jgi:cytochrome o ubiquinol oxidase subunit 2
MREQFFRAIRAIRFALLAPLVSLAGCQHAVLNPAGDVALQQRNLIYASSGLMLVIIVPVMILTVVFAWRYRKGGKATYDPQFAHSTSLELVIWTAPLFIVIALGALTWSSTHLLDPFRPLDRIAAGSTGLPAATPLRVQVVALDWKWLFIYPDQGIATVNQLVLPIDREVRFDITSANMMNTFYAPTLAGMVYAMPGMQSTLHAVLNRPGDYEGYSANYSGAGFTDMRFTLKGVGQTSFDRWVERTKAGARTLRTIDYLALEKPSEKAPPMLFAQVVPGLFDRVVNRCVAPGAPCMSDVMAHDRRADGAMDAGHEAPPQPGGKPKGALFKTGADMAPRLNVTQRRKPGAPGSTQPASPRNRDMSFLLPPIAPGAGRG